MNEEPVLIYHRFFLSRAPLTDAQVDAGATVYRPDRYADETVNINLRMAAQPTGNAMEWAAP